MISAPRISMWFVDGFDREEFRSLKMLDKEYFSVAASTDDGNNLKG
jgi:hypothetical protein